MNISDFDRRFKRTGRIMSVFAVFIAALWVGLMGLIIWAVYSFATADPKQVAREAGTIAVIQSALDKARAGG